MKKSIAILSMALLAGNAFAADVLVPGTDEAPKYYVIKANRGLPYVTYTAEKKNNGGAETSLYRANELSEEAVWAVVAGTEEGTVNIYNYTTKDSKYKQYMFSFITKSDAEFDGGSGAVATTGGAKDVYVKNYGTGSYGLALENENGFVNVDGGSKFYGLDATGGTSEFLGNWYCANDGGSQWWFYAVDESDIAGSLENIEYSIIEEAMKAQVNSCINELTAYATAVPVVEEYINDGIDALGQLEVSADYQEKIDAIRSECVGKANAALNTMFAGKEVALKNIRKGMFLGIIDGALKGVADSFTDDAIFILEGTTYENVTEATETTEESTEEIPSYYIYNAASKQYISDARTLVDGQDAAGTFTLGLQIGYDSGSANGIAGVVIRANGVSGNNAFNLNNATPPGLDYWKASGADSNGSIWSVVAADEESIVEYITSASIEKLQAYIPNVPAMVGEILTAGIAEIKALPNSDDLAEKAEEIVASTIENANNLFSTGVDGLQQVIYYPRGNRYLAYNSEAEDWAPVADADIENGVFTIKTVEGGVILFNEAHNIYVGPCVYFGRDKNETGGNAQVDVPAVAEESEAQVFTIQLNSNGSNYGVSFVFTYEYEEEEEGETVTKQGQQALNMNSNAKCLHTYYVADGGSVFGLRAVPEQGGEDDSIREIGVAPAAQGIYDLAGRKLAAPVKGINIINGVKVLVK